MINDLRHFCLAAAEGVSIKQVVFPLVGMVCSTWLAVGKRLDHGCVASQWQNTAGQAVHTIASSVNKTTTPHSTKGVTSFEVSCFLGWKYT